MPKRTSTRSAVDYPGRQTKRLRADDSTFVDTDGDDYKGLFLELFGQGDCLKKIFSFIRSPKEKTRLQLVCKTFQRLLEQPESWELDDVLEIEDAAEESDAASLCLLNGDSVSIDRVGLVLDQLINRIRLTALDLWNCMREEVYSTVAATLMRCKKPVNLEWLLLNARQNDSYIVPFITAYKETLTMVQVRNCSFRNASAARQFWRSVEQCRRLSIFLYISTVKSATGDQTTTSNMVEDALRGKPLKTLGLFDLEQLTTMSALQILANIEPGNLETFEISIGSLTVETLLRQLNDGAFRNLKRLALLRLEMTEREREALIGIPALCPQLNSCGLCVKNGDFPFMWAQQIVDGFLVTLAGEDRQLEFEINNTSERNMRELLGYLIMNMKCDSIAQYDDDDGTRLPVVIRKKEGVGKIVLRQWD